MTFLSLLTELGLSQNESLIYEALIRHGELGVSDVARHAGAHRRNVYDSMKRLIDKGLAYEILDKRTTTYQAVEPRKLLDLLDERRNRLTNALPTLERLYKGTPTYESVAIYRGIEGLKNYMRDIIRSGQDYYSIGAKGIWADPRLATLFPSFIKDAERKGINFYILFDYAVYKNNHPILRSLPSHYRILPKKFQTPSSLGAFGEMSVVLTNMKVGQMGERISLTILRNKNMADTIRTWFHALWGSAIAPNKI
jgi:predicted DNA-binding transcriptional regulator